MRIFDIYPLSGRTVTVAVALLTLQIPVSRFLFALYLQESLWHFHLVFTFFAIALLLAYRYGFRGGLISSLLSTLIVAAVELAHFGATNQHLDVHLTVTVGLATLATGVAASVSVGLLAHILQAQRKWLEALFSSTSDGLIVITRYRKVLAMNPAAQQITGWTDDELAAFGGCAVLFGCDRDTRKCPESNAACPISLSGNPAQSGETEIVHRNGSLVPVSLEASSVELPALVWRPETPAAVAITIRDIATARRLQAELDGLAKVCTDISSLPNVTRILQEITSRAGSILGADLAVIALVDGADQQLTLQHAAGRGAERVIGLKIPPGEGGLGRACRVGAPIVIRNLTDEPRDRQERYPLAQATGLVSQIAVPFGGSGGPLGVIAVGWSQPQVILPNQVNVLRQLSNLAGVALENSYLLAQIQRRRQEAEALYHMGLEIASLSDFDRKLEVVLEQTRKLLSADVTALWTAPEGENAGSWTVVCPSDSSVARTWLARAGHGLVAEATQAGRVLKVENAAAPVDFSTPGSDGVEQEHFRSAVALPLQVRGRRTGALCVGYHATPVIDEDALLFLSGLSNQLSVAMENAKLYSRVQELAVIEERNRLSREIHDGLAQILSVLNLRAESLKKGLGRLRPPHAEHGVASRQKALTELTHDVEELQAIVDSAYSEVRHSIWNLRRQGESDQDMTSLLQVFIEQFRRYTGISVSLESECSAQLRLPLSIELHVIRIIQESLNNVRKHSGVKTALLSVRIDGETLVLEVRDHGRGFDPEVVHRSETGNYGLASMNERAKAIGAELSVNSRPGDGTTVTLRIAMERLSA